MPSSRVLLVVRTVALALGVMVSPLSAATIHVRAGDNLQAALNAAQPGDVVLLDAGATFSGNFTLPAKAGSTHITIRTSTPDDRLPASGVRITPAHAPLLAKIQSPNTAPALRTAAGAHHWRLQLLEFGPNAGGFGDILQIGDGSWAQFQLSQVPSEIDVDRVYIHGDPAVGQKRGIALNGRSVTIRNSYISDIKSVGQDSQAIGGWNGPGQYTIENNYLEAAGENVLLGGADPAIPYVVAEDVVFRRNHVAKPLAWRGQPWQIKNLFELKNARRVLVEYNVFENNWNQAQPGYAILLTPRNQGGGCPWCVVEDVTFQYNVVRNAGGGINLTGFDDLNPSAQTANVRFRHNLFSGVTQSSGTGWFMLIGSQPRDIVIDHNTIDHDGTAVVYAHGGTASAPERIFGFVFTNNAARHNVYGINGANASTGNATISMYFPDGVIRGNWLAGGTASRYPAGNLFAGDYDAAFVNARASDYRLSPASLLLSAATDGSSVGADMPTLLDGVAGVVEGTPASSGGSVTWAAPPQPAPPPPAASTCVGTAPFPGGVCVDGGWVPADHPLALNAGATVTTSSGGSSTAASTILLWVPSTTSTCAGSPPASGWVCVNGGWVPANHPAAAGASSGGGSWVVVSSGAPTSSGGATSAAGPGTPSGAGTCVGQPPAVGWVCVVGGAWVPPDHPLAKK